jgi:hypothetical protein
MNKVPSHQVVNRRDLLKLLGVAGMTVAGGYLLFEYTPWLNYDQQADDTHRPFAKNSTAPAPLRELVRYATLAANGHNTQPWKFLIHENAIEIHPDYARRLPVVDPHDRELWISLGCALENLIIAARATRYAAEVIYPDATDFITVRLAADIPQANRLFDAIPPRQNTRSEYDGQAIKRDDFGLVQALSLEPGIVLQFVANPTDRERVLEYVNQGNLIQYADTAFLDELTYWLRFNKKEVLASLDGLYSRCSGNPEVPRWLGQLFVTSLHPQQQADVDAQKLRSSPGVVVVASDSDDRTAWVRTGQVYERLALQLTALNIKSALLNQPIEVAGIRGQFQNAIGLGTARPQLLVRFGYADSMPRSLRRPVEQVLVQA